MQKWFVLFLLCALFCFRAEAQGMELTDRYLSIRDRLTDLKKNSELVTEQLTRVSENLRISQEEAKKWEETSTALSESLMSINQQYNDCYEQLVIQRTKNQTLLKALLVLIGICASLLLVKFVFVVLYLKKVPVPRMVDILA